MKNLLLLTFLYSSFFSFSQNYAPKDFYLIDSLDLSTLSADNRNIIDSCLTIYHQTNSDTTKWNVLNEIIENTYDEIWIKYQYIANDITDRSIAKKNSKYLQNQKSSNLNNMAYWAKSKGELKKALTLYQQSIEISEKTKNVTLLPIQYNNLAGIYYKIGDIPKALKNYEKSIAIGRKNENKYLAQIIANVAMVYKNVEQEEEALKLLKEALNIEHNNSNKSLKALILSDLGSIYESSMNDYDKAIKYHEKSLELNLKIGFKRKAGTNYEHIAKCYLRKEDTLTALEYLRKSKELYIEVKDKSGIVSSNYEFASILENQGKIDSAIKLSDASLKIAKEIGSPRDIKRVSAILKRLYPKINNYRKANEMYDLYDKMKDSLGNIENVKSLAKTEVKLQFEKEKEIDRLKHEQDIALEEKEKEKQTLYKRIALLGSLSLTIILIFIVLQLKKSIHQKKIIEASSLKLEEKNKEITDSISYTKRIQTAILPQKKEIDKYIPNSFIYYIPKDIISGDFYWLEAIEDNVFFAVADCTGHGVPGAMVSIICNNGLNRSVREHKITDVNKILDKTRDLVINEFYKSGDNIKDGMDISLISINLKNNYLSFSGAQNSAWIIRKGYNSNIIGDLHKVYQYNDYSIIELKGDKQPIGNYDKAYPFTLKKLELKTGDTIYLFSDGIIDQFGGDKNKKLKIKNFREFLTTIQEKPLDVHREEINSLFINWKGDNEQLDDVCIAGIRI